MPYTFDDLVAHQRRRWMRPNAHLWTRPDAQRFMRPDPSLALPNKDSWRHPDERLWNFHAAHRRRTNPAWLLGDNPSPAADLARLQVQHDSIQHAFVQLRQEQQRQRERALERAEAERLKRRYDAAWDKFIAAFNRYWDTCRKAGFDPNQPRVPAGQADGGQWTDADGAIGGGDSLGVRLAASDKPSLGRGTIAAVIAQAAKQAIDAYRKSNYLWDLFGSKIGTVAVTRIDDTDLFGSNSTSPTYTNADRAAAVRLREKLLERHPDIMNLEEVGQKPNDALFHAETTVLTRAARANGGSLAGRTLDVHVDREICPSCDAVLPLVGLELGNPTVTFVETTGRRQTMRNGSWITGDR